MCCMRNCDFVDVDVRIPFVLDDIIALYAQQLLRAGPRPPGIERSQTDIDSRNPGARARARCAKKIVLIHHWGPAALQCRSSHSHVS